MFSIFWRASARIGLGALVGALLASLAVLRPEDGGRTVAAVAALMFVVGMLTCALRASIPAQAFAQRCPPRAQDNCEPDRGRQRPLVSSHRHRAVGARS